MILVTGISGVGKTHTIESFIRRYPNFVRVGASALLASSGKKTKDLVDEDAAENQAALVGLLTGPDGPPRERMIVDGHAVIETLNGFLPVPDYVVKALLPDAIVTLFDDTDSLAARRIQKGVKHSVLTSQELQAVEIERSRLWGGILGIPFAALPTADLEMFEDFLVWSGVEL